MNYNDFFKMIPEASLVAILIILFVADFISAKTEERKWFNPLASVLLLANTVVCMLQLQPEDAFGCMYVTSTAVNVMKAILAFGTFIVVLQSRVWAEKSGKEGEFYMLVVSTLLGMEAMMSAGNFLMFFLGLEMASVPMACVIAFDAYRNNSAEAAAKFILTATFSSGVMLYGISFLYGAYGTMYFSDITDNLQATPFTIMGLVFFFSGLGFKISLVPFHFWTADTYQGAPTTVTGYLSVISKGAAAFTLLSILFHVFGSMMAYWHVLMMIVVALSITVANLFAIRQGELKRFMAFSSISQAGYIMLAALGNNWASSVAALSYYVLIYVVANMAVFTIISVVEQNNGGKTNIADYNGFYKTNPRLSFLMTIAMFSLGGIPPFAGMFSKFFVFMSGVDGADIATTEGAWTYVILFVALINTVVSLYYYLKIVKAMYIIRCDTPMPTFKSDCNTKFTLALCTAGIVLFGVCSCVYDWIAAAI
ncbi:NADH-quinone oxidoreductase subunit N [Prevotella nigrescens]|uniref:NADH-quinone oxidoreductase subunit N n=1 Tax=Prevotella nigrescens TaxID=28133 RepID=UPI000218210F|nr:NADH-quinone oxidoreductase subunit N [Prevotella nigrescens]EGQ12109.1 NADH dehydrogenase (ubiquinone) [Prevotella nigrescens ATCC 33563]UAK29631.1 NADH-quinone oxidoreductase subunit N [Prevotella nigrescens]WMS21067.1 NADH-quinone oxidoreductase subunit N [Prevotella nigrescens]SUB96965.1 NADH-quinone oxidoreductase subunit N [Prevotella nigrescens]